MACRVAVTCLILLFSSLLFGFTDAEIRLYETRSEIEADIYAGDEVVYQGEIDNLDFMLSDFQVASMNIHELMLLRNAVYAKYGYEFRNEIIFEHFKDFDWYDPESDDVSVLLDDTDLWNIELILYYEDRLEASYTGLPGEDEVVGFWHGSESVGSGYSDRFFFYPDGRFIFRENTMNGGARLRELSGEWYLDDNHLVLETDSVHYIVSGEIVEPFASIGSEYYIDSGELVYFELRPHEVFRLPLEDYFEGGEQEDFDYPVLPNMRIGYGRYWRMAADPANEYLN